jgi:type I restriction enzyme M protein
MSKKVKPKATKPSPKRRSILDSLPTQAKNIYCEAGSLTNEASVETFFLSRLLRDLGWKDSQIKTKKSIESLKVGHGAKKELYKPDYALTVKGKVHCIVEAKAPEENLHNYIEQCTHYCINLNRRYKAENPVRYFLLSNGHTSELYEWDHAKPLVTLDFTDFDPSNKKFILLKQLLDPSNIANLKSKAPSVVDEMFEFTRPTSEKARQLFALCHKVIWKSEVCSPSAAFLEFVKIMFVKMYEDRKLRYGEATRDFFQEDDSVAYLPSSSMRFSTNWIEQREAEGDSSPVDTILFGNLRRSLEKEIKDASKKRVFNENERINLRPDTIKDIVGRLEHYDMFGIDEDLNGRLFETFLNATMRGRELGQFFTPRSVVNMMTFLADLKATPSHQDIVMDGCCGSGGFLIEAFTVMRDQVRNNKSLSHAKKEQLINKISNECIFGIDFGKDPPLARIARANMYLHGDGGSHIFYADALDKDVKSFASDDDLELSGNLKELRNFFRDFQGFDVILTNPPFSMAKEWKNPSERRILQQYKLARRDETSSAYRPSLRSSIMYMERYYELLRPKGKLLTVIDDTLLSSNVFGYVRDYIREHFLIRAIISLPGDTFKRSGSRVKCSVLFLEKKEDLSDAQPHCFAYFAEHLGVDDLTPRASDADILEARTKANAEIDKIVSGYQDFLAGKSTDIALNPDQLADRLDLKNCVPLFGRMTKKWRKDGIEVRPFSECVTLVEDLVIPKQHPNEKFTLLKVSYDGRCEIDKINTGNRIKAQKMYRVRTGHLLFSTIRATDGAIGIVPPEMDGALVSGSYSVFECGTPEETAYLWSILRSHEIRADMQSLSPGSGRYTTYWPDVGVVLLPWLIKAKRQKIGHGILHSRELERQMRIEHEKALAEVHALGVESEESVKRWQASKAPQ